MGGPVITLRNKALTVTMPRNPSWHEVHDDTSAYRRRGRTDVAPGRRDELIAVGLGVPVPPRRPWVAS